jgi:hypothetical protein
LQAFLTAWPMLALALPDYLQSKRTDHLVSILRIAPPQSYRSAALTADGKTSNTVKTGIK